MGYKFRERSCMIHATRNTDLGYVEKNEHPIVLTSSIKYKTKNPTADGRGEYFIETNVYVVFPVYLLRQLRQHRHIVLFK
jgi:hypothetical protein